MSPLEISTTLRTALGILEEGWQAASGHVKGGTSFTVIRYDATMTKGQVRRIHSLIEDMLSEELGQGDRV